MAITRGIKQERGYELTGYDLFEEIAMGDRPPLGDAAKVAPWLPVLTQERRSSEFWVLLAGRIVSVDRTLSDRDQWGNTWDAALYSGGYAPRIVPANSSGGNVPITYGANDINYTVSVDDQTALVAVAGAATAPLPANAPIGWIQGNAYSESIPYRYKNYDKQLPITVICKYYVEVATLGLSGQSSLAPGELVKAYTGTGVGDPYMGCPTYFDASSDSVEQAAGRVIMMSEIPYSEKARSRMDLLKNVRGLSMPGSDTTGKPKWLSESNASNYLRINIGFM